MTATQIVPAGPADLYEFISQLVYRVGLERSDARRLSEQAPWTATEGAADE